MRSPIHQPIRLFQNPLLEKLTYVHPVVPAAVWLPVISILLLYSVKNLRLASSSIIILGILGLITWSLTEYLLHRFLFHWNTRVPGLKRCVYLIHGIHHDDPDDSRRLLMPPVAAALFAGFFYSIFLWLLGEVKVVPFFAFFLIGYLIYDYIHFASHHVKPTTKVGRYLRQSHMIHHFISADLRYGVSSPLWDLAFGTYTKAKPSHFKQW